MFDRVDAIRFDRLMSSGKNKPMLMTCEDANAAEIEVIAKFSAKCSIGGLIREAMASMLAADLGLPIPQPVLVELSPQFIATIRDAEVTAILEGGDSFGFGSKRLPNGFAAWMPPADGLTGELAQQALEILAFDCWLTNGDRMVSNHNLLCDGRSFAIFDHELALMTDLNLFWQEPWIPNALAGTWPPEKHVFFEHLRHKAVGSLEGISGRLSALTDPRIMSYTEALPPSWVRERAAVESARTFIMSLRDNLAPAVVELTRALS